MATSPFQTLPSSSNGYTYAATPKHRPTHERRPAGRRLKASTANSRRSDRRRGPQPIKGALHSLSLRLETAREQERARVARELHDELGQVLTTLKLEFVWLVEELGKTHPKPGLQMANKLQALVGLIEVSLQSVRQISADLRPAVLDHLGLVDAIKWETAKFEARTGIRCRFTCELKRVFGDATRALALFRILQEALSNVTRHAHAKVVRIMLKERGNYLTLTVKDNGRGITKAEMSSVESIGLLGMVERARLLGGRVTIAGVSGRGTTVAVKVPIA
jgi:two-component system, NarL family, sensor histidine kinase UhpB